VFTSDWAFFWYHDCSINWYRVVIMTHQNLRLGKCWKLFWATLSGQQIVFPNIDGLFEINRPWNILSYLFLLTNCWCNRAKKLVNDVLHSFCTLSNRKITVHFSYMPYVLELSMGWKCTWCFVAMNFRFTFILCSPIKAFCYLEAVKSCLLPFLSNFFVPLLRGQPLLSGHFFKVPRVAA